MRPTPEPAHPKDSLLAIDALTTAVPFGEWLSSGSAVRFLSHKISIVIHRNIRFLLVLMLNVEVPVPYQLSTTSGSGPGIGNATMNDFTPRAQQVLALARTEAERQTTTTWELNTSCSG